MICAVSTGALSESAETCRWSSSWRPRRPARSRRPARARYGPALGTGPAGHCTARPISTSSAWPATPLGAYLTRNTGRRSLPRSRCAGRSAWGLSAQLAAEVLFGVQQRTRDGLTTRLHVLRALVEDLRRSEVTSLDPRWQAVGPMAREKGQIGRSLARYVRAAAGDTAAETAAGMWDLAVFGSSGTLTFTGIRQQWLRQAVKRWAADEIPRHRGERPHARIQRVVAAAARLSAWPPRPGPAAAAPRTRRTGPGGGRSRRPGSR